MIETKLLSALLKSRAFYSQVCEVIEPANYSKHFQLIFNKIKDFYARDKEVPSVDVDLLLEGLKSDLDNTKHFDAFKLAIERAVGCEVSEGNLSGLLIEAKRQELGTKLSVAIINRDLKKVPELLEGYKNLLEASSLEEMSDGEDDDSDIFEGVDVGGLVEEVNQPRNLIKLFPKILNERVGGGVPRGTHILLYGRPESGKTAQAYTLTVGFASQGLKVLHISNEDPKQSVKLRLVSCLTGLTKDEILRNPGNAQRLAEDNGLGNVIIASLAPGNYRQIRKLCEKYKPDCIVIDQLRNVETGSGEDNRVIQLEKNGTFGRSLAKIYEAVVVSVTQAGDSASGKAVLDMGDVDFSNTGLPAQADIMIGVGVTEELERNSERCYSLPKNKISGNHEPFYVKINPFISRITSI